MDNDATLDMGMNSPQNKRKQLKKLREKVQPRVSIEITGESIEALMLKYRQFLVLSGVKQPSVEEQAMGVTHQGPTFEAWMAKELKILEIISPNGMWSYGPHALMFANENDALLFKNVYMRPA